MALSGMVLILAGLACNLSRPDTAQTIGSQPTATGGHPGGLALTDTPTNTLAPTMPEPTITGTFTITPTPAPKMFGFLSCLAECRADGSNGADLFPEKSAKIFVRWNYENIPAGSAYTRVWTNRGEEWARYECAWPGPETGADAITLTEPYGLRSGVWTMTITVGGKLIMKETLEIQGDWDYWDPAGTFNTCYGKAASGPGPGRIVFSSTRDGNSEIYVMNADGSHLTRLTSDPESDFEPAWSPDGKRVAFVSHRPWTEEIFVMDADGSNVTQLTHNLGHSPAWSPDGTRIAYENDPGIQYQIFVMDADGSNVIQLTDDELGNTDPAWSPDGNRIAFKCDRGGTDEICVMGVDGSNVTQLTDSPVHKGFPSWSPDGKRIAFTSDTFNPGEIYVIDADGSHMTRLTDNPADDVNPSWSPDGKRIAFSSNRDGNSEIYVMDADGSNVIRLTNNPADDSYPDW